MVKRDDFWNGLFSKKVLFREEQIDVLAKKFLKLQNATIEKYFVNEDKMHNVSKGLHH